MSGPRPAHVEAACDWAATRPEVAALLLVGSGVEGFADDWSDVDLVAVVDGPSTAETVAAAEVWLRGRGAVAVTRWEHREGVDVLCALLADGLEIDLGIWAVNLLFAAGPRWVLLRSRDDAAARSVEHALAEHPAPVRDRAPVVSGDDAAWIEARAAVVRAQRAGGHPEGIGLRHLDPAQRAAVQRLVAR